MPDRVKSAIKRIDEARDKVREDDFFKDLDAESLVDIVLNDPSSIEPALRDLASTFIQRNQKVLEDGIDIGIKLGEEFLR